MHKNTTSYNPNMTSHWFVFGYIKYRDVLQMHTIYSAFSNDEDSKLGSYLTINPNFQTPTFRNNLLEFERVTITRLRSGSHNLQIEKGRHRYPITQREQRLCKCGTAAQTVRHFLMECPLLQHLRNEQYNSVHEFIKSGNIIYYIINGAKILHIEL